MQAIVATQATQPGPNRTNPGLLRRFAVPIALLASCLGLLLLAEYATGRLREAESLLARSFDDTLTARNEARNAASEMAHLRIGHMQARITIGHDERARLEDRVAEQYRALVADLAAIAARTRSVRVGQAAVAAQEAVGVWHESMRSEAAMRDGALEVGRLADGADGQIARLAAATERYGQGVRRTAEAAVSDALWRIRAIVGGVILLVPILAWLVVRRYRTAPARVTAPCRSDDASAAPTGGGDRISAEPTLATLCDLARNGMVAIGANGRIAYANAAAAVLAGIEGDTLRPGQMFASSLAALAQEDPAEGEYDVRLADGRWISVSRTPMPDGGALLILGEVSERKRRDARADATVSSLRTALDSMSQGLCLYDAAHRLVLANRRYEEIYRHEPNSLPVGISATDVLERSMAMGNHPGSTISDLMGEAGRILASADRDDSFQELAGGRIIQINVGPTADGGFVATYDDVTERWHAESRIAHMARHDGLTDLPNRLLLAERIEGAITQASRDAGFAVHCLDLDNFKQINDTLGHAVGDELLRAVAHRLTACVREVDTVARLGGDEFAIVQAGVGRPEDAAVLARHVIEVLGVPYALAEHSVTIGVSIGIALAPSDGMAPDRLLKNADVALYKSKGDGRGVFRFFEAEMDARLQARRLLEIDLRAAVAEDAFELHYQPVYDLSQNRISGFEALLRWTHPTRGRVSPVEFVPLAEEIGLIATLGEWVLRQACAEAARWPGSLKIAVNVSPAQFRSAQLIRTVREALAETGLPAQRLELEITESVLLADRGATVAILHTLRGLGVHIAMDDFGTGYSSLSYLRSFPFDKMKIDQSFIRDLTVESGSGFIVQAVISLGTSLGMTMTAEGVETEAQLARLREEGCDEVQGYLISPPVPVWQIGGLLEKWNGAGEAARVA